MNKELARSAQIRLQAIAEKVAGQVSEQTDSEDVWVSCEAEEMHPGHWVIHLDIWADNCSVNYNYSVEEDVYTIHPSVCDEFDEATASILVTDHVEGQT